MIISLWLSVHHQSLILILKGMCTNYTCTCKQCTCRQCTCKQCTCRQCTCVMYMCNVHVDNVTPFLYGKLVTSALHNTRIECFYSSKFAGFLCTYKDYLHIKIQTPSTYKSLGVLYLEKLICACINNVHEDNVDTVHVHVYTCRQCTCKQCICNLIVPESL